MNKEETIKHIIVEAQKHRIGCNLAKECNSECDKCALEDLLVDPIAEKMVFLSYAQSRQSPSPDV